MNEPNWTNRTMWTGDNLDIMRSMNSESVDLIYLDPPFNSNQDYAAPIGSEAAGAAFKDTWTLDDVDLAWHGEIAEQHPALYAIIGAAREAHGAAMQSYLIMMGVRLLEMRRLLKPTGSIYLQNTSTANLRTETLMDAVFGSTTLTHLVVEGRSMSLTVSAALGDLQKKRCGHCTHKAEFTRIALSLNSNAIWKNFLVRPCFPFGWIFPLSIPVPKNVSATQHRSHWHFSNASSGRPAIQATLC